MESVFIQFSDDAYISISKNGHLRSRVTYRFFRSVYWFLGSSLTPQILRPSDFFLLDRWLRMEMHIALWKTTAKTATTPRKASPRKHPQHHSTCSDSMSCGAYVANASSSLFFPVISFHLLQSMSISSEKGQKQTVQQSTMECNDDKFFQFRFLEVFWKYFQYVRMISGGSRDTKDWSNIFAITGINYILKY